MNREELKKEAQEQVNYCTPLYPQSFIQGYLAGAEPRENKIAEIKANCDLAIEGRDIKIKELELELTVEKDLHQEETNLHLHAEEYIKSLEKENEEMKKGLGCETCQIHLEYIILNDKINDLEKENAELKKENEELPTIAFQQGAEWWKKKTEKKLAQAKEIIKEFVCHYNNKTIYVNNVKPLLEQAEQFLKEIDK